MIDTKEWALGSTFFEGLDPQHLTMIRRHAREAEFKPGEVLFKEGEPANCLYVIESGRVVLEARKSAARSVAIETLGPGEVFGWSWLFPPFTWHFRARALEATKALVVNGANLLGAAEEDHTFGYELIKRVQES